MVKITYIPLRNNYRPNRAYGKSAGLGSYNNVFCEIQLINQSQLQGPWLFWKVLWLMRLAGWRNCDEVMG